MASASGVYANNRPLVTAIERLNIVMMNGNDTNIVCPE